MRNFDHNGLLLAEYQGKLFEESASRFPCSTKVFLRRFYYSKLLEKLDKIMDKLDDILAAIKDHNVTVDVTGKVTCECNCGQNHEGILGDLNDILS